MYLGPGTQSQESTPEAAASSRLRLAAEVAAAEYYREEGVLDSRHPAGQSAADEWRQLIEGCGIELD